MLGLFKHRRVSGLLSSYIDGQVSPGERRLIEDHLPSCDSCSGELDELRQTISLLGSLPELRPGRSYVLSSAHQDAPVRRPALGFSLWAPGIAAAACAVLLVVVISGQAAGVLVQSGGFGAEPEAYADEPLAADSPEPMSFDDMAEESSFIAEEVAMDADSEGSDEFDVFEGLELMEADDMESEADIDFESVQALAASDEDEVDAMAIEAQTDFSDTPDTEMEISREQINTEGAAENQQANRRVATTLEDAAVEDAPEPGSEGVALPLWQIQLAAALAFAVFSIAALVAVLARRSRR